MAASFERKAMPYDEVASREFDALTNTHESTKQNPRTRLRKLSSALLVEQYNANRPTAQNTTASIALFEIDNTAKTTFRETTLRNLTNYINLLINLIDESPVPTGLVSAAIKNRDDLSVQSSTKPSSRLTVDVPRRRSMLIDKMPHLTPEAGLAKANHPLLSGRPVDVNSSNLSTKSAVSIESRPSGQRPFVPEQRQFTATKLSHRDIRRLDWKHNPSTDPILLVRRHCILLSFHPFRAIIMAQRIFVVVPDDRQQSESALFRHVFPPVHSALLDWMSASASSKPSVDGERSPKAKTLGRESPGVGELPPLRPSPSRPRGREPSDATSKPDAGLLRKGDFPFEFHCIEMLVSTTLCIQSHYVRLYSETLRSTLPLRQELATNQQAVLVGNQVDGMKLLGGKIQSLQDSFEAMKDILEEVVRDDEEMALMNLSTLLANPSLYRFPLREDILRTHERTEELLEVYLFDINLQITKLANMQRSIHYTQENIAVQLNTLENKVLIGSTLIMVLACCVALNGVLAGIFGMNLNWSTLETYPFYVVLVTSLVGIGLLFYVAKRWLIYSGYIPAKMLLSRQHTLNL